MDNPWSATPRRHSGGGAQPHCDLHVPQTTVLDTVPPPTIRGMEIRTEMPAPQPSAERPRKTTKHRRSGPNAPKSTPTKQNRKKFNFILIRQGLPTLLRSGCPSLRFLVYDRAAPVALRDIKCRRRSGRGPTETRRAMRAARNGQRRRYRPLHSASHRVSQCCGNLCYYPRRFAVTSARPPMPGGNTEAPMRETS